MVLNAWGCGFLECCFQRVFFSENIGLESVVKIDWADRETGGVGRSYVFLSPENDSVRWQTNCARGGQTQVAFEDPAHFLVLATGLTLKMFRDHFQMSGWLKVAKAKRRSTKPTRRMPRLFPIPHFLFFWVNWSPVLGVAS
jgi:hypothetical protein